MSKYDVAFVIPVYNIGDYLEECLDSVLKQTKINMQIILVNNGSNDNSSDICMKYSRKYKFIKVINMGKVGVSIARNYGLKEVKAEYTCFLDGDDYYIDDFAYNFYKKAKENNLDIIRGRYQRINNYRKEQFPKKIICKQSPISGREFLQQSIKMKCSEVVPWLGFFKTSFLNENNIFFPEGVSYTEDQIVYLKSLLISECKIMDVDVCFYEYRVRENSATSGRYSKKKVEDIILMTNEELKLINLYPQYIKDITKFASATFSQIFPFYKRADKREKEELINYVKKNGCRKVLKYSYSSKILIKNFLMLKCKLLLKFIGFIKFI